MKLHLLNQQMEGGAAGGGEPSGGAGASEYPFMESCPYVSMGGTVLLWSCPYMGMSGTALLWVMSICGHG